MRLGLFLVLFGDLSIAEALDRAVAAGVDDVEIGTGNYPGAAHCDPAALLADANGLAAFRHAIDSRGLSVSAGGSADDAGRPPGPAVGCRGRGVRPGPP